MVVTLQSHLYIIDFDISVRVDGLDELIDQWRGTPPWMAPEIGDQDVPRRIYIPIRADLWSCGLVLWYLASRRGEEDDMFETLARQLLNKNPYLPPMLTSSSSGKATGKVTPPPSDHGGLKRKRDTSHQAELPM
jgi:serine/threonine protein kinase